MTQALKPLCPLLGQAQIIHKCTVAAVFSTICMGKGVLWVVTENCAQSMMRSPVHLTAVTDIRKYLIKINNNISPIKSLK